MPYSYLALAHSRQDDLLREAERHRLAAAAPRDGLTLRARLTALVRRPAPRASVPRYRSRSAV